MIRPLAEHLSTQAGCVPGLMAAVRQQGRGRQRTICGVGVLPGTGAAWRSVSHPDDLVPLARPDPVPPRWGLTCAGQLVTVPAGRYDWIYLVIEPDRDDLDDAAEEVWLHYENAVDPEWLYLRRDQTAARLPVARDALLTHLRLPSRETLRVVAATLVGPMTIGGGETSP